MGAGRGGGIATRPLSFTGGAQGPSPFPSSINFGPGGGPTATIKGPFNRDVQTNLFSLEAGGQLRPLQPDVNRLRQAGTQIIDVPSGDPNITVPRAIKEQRRQEGFALRFAPEAKKEDATLEQKQTLPPPVETAPEVETNREQKVSPRIRRRRSRGRTLLEEKLGGDIILGA